jgi:RNA polymerase sigma factor (sigma-70 family)
MTLRKEALYACYQRLERPLYNVLFRQLWQREDCQDLIHDSFMRVWEKHDDVNEETLDALIWTTALNLAKNRLRWRVLRQHEPIDEEVLQHLATDNDSHDFLAERRVCEALRKLPITWREVLLLSEFSGMRGNEMAKVLGIPAGTVASRKHLALTRLKELLGADFHART